MLGAVQNSQVSIWVPIVVGVIGVVGVIAGQLINAWREDRRWKREQEREEIRWLRESRRESIKLDRDTKVAAYGQLLQTLDRANLLLDQLRNIGAESNQGNIEEYLRITNDVRLKVAELQLICSDELLTWFRDNTSDLYLLPAMMYEADVTDPKTGDRVGYMSPKEALKKIAQFRAQFLKVARAELVMDGWKPT